MSLVTLGAARGAARGGHRREHAVAAHDHRDRRGAEPARRRRGDEPRAHAGDLRRLGVRGPDPAAREYTGQSLIDDEVLAAAGVTDLEPYRAGPGDGELIGDLFVDPAPLR